MAFISCADHLRPCLETILQHFTRWFLGLLSIGLHYLINNQAIVIFYFFNNLYYVK